MAGAGGEKAADELRMLEESLDKPISARAGGSQDDYWPSGEHVTTERCLEHEDAVYGEKIKTLETSREELLKQLRQTSKKLEGLTDGKRLRDGLRLPDRSGLAWGPGMNSPRGGGARMSGSPPLDDDARYKTDRSRNAASIF